MTQEEKQLLLTDLCARLPYGVICQFIWTYNNETTNGEDVTAKENDNIKGINLHIEEIQADYYDEWVDLEHCKPYLRPMSSMTEEEREEWADLFNSELEKLNKIEDEEEAERLAPYYFAKSHEVSIDWLNKKWFDYRGLIPMGLALEAPEGMYK